MDKLLSRKKIISLIITCLLLSACERPATVSNWSPLANMQTSPTEDLSTMISETEVDTPTFSTPMMIGGTASPIPTIDIDDLPDTLPHLLKGYELVSWQSGNEWNFTLVSGTNRQKTFEELVSPESFVTKEGYVKITVKGVESIKQVLERVPAGESVAWGGMNLSGQVPSGTIYFAYPQQEIMDELMAVAKENGFDLYTLQESE